MFFLFAAWAGTCGAEPRLVCEASTFDFGSMMDTQVVYHTFVLRNTGDATATGVRVYSGCNCTTALPYRSAISPGEREPLTVQFDLKDRRGQQRKWVYVSWSGVSSNSVSTLRLMFSGTIAVSGKNNRADAVSVNALK
jgi:hypothetical protein